MAAYSWFTIKTTAWRTKFRKQANAADNRAATMSVDSLINYEAVKVRETTLSLFLNPDHWHSFSLHLTNTHFVDSISTMKHSKYDNTTKL